jgi:hypothetical protein
MYCNFEVGDLFAVSVTKPEADKERYIPLTQLFSLTIFDDGATGTMQPSSGFCSIHKTWRGNFYSATVVKLVNGFIF